MGATQSTAAASEEADEAIRTLHAAADAENHERLSAAREEEPDDIRTEHAAADAENHERLAAAREEDAAADAENHELLAASREEEADDIRTKHAAADAEIQERLAAAREEEAHDIRTKHAAADAEIQERLASASAEITRRPEASEARVAAAEKERPDAAHLYKVARVATSADLATQIGSDRVFDLVDHAKVARVLRIKKERPLFALKQEIWRLTGALPAQQRLWLWVKRQNYTYRPDRCLQPEFRNHTAIRDVRQKYNKPQKELCLYLEVVGEQPAGPPAVGAPAPDGAEHESWPAMAAGSILLFLKYYDPQVWATCLVVANGQDTL